MEFKLIIKKLNNTLSESETQIFSDWYNESELHRDYFNKVKENFNGRTDNLSVNILRGWQSVEKEIKPFAKRKNNFIKYAVAASIILLVSITLLWKKDNSTVIDNGIKMTNNIEIGSDKATLTLEDGTMVALKKGQQYISNNLESNGEDLIYKSSNEERPKMAYNYLTIPRGGQYHVKLSDGTEVWLNSESRLKYPVKFVNGEPRNVELVYGEAYFDVTSSSDNQGSIFKVQTKSQDIIVLGTEFNIKAYNDESTIYSTLVEGKVVVSLADVEKSLNPGDQSCYNILENKIRVKSVDVAYETSWKNGYFMFDKESLGSMMKTLSRWYDVDVIFESEHKKSIIFSGILNRSDSVEELLTNIQKTGEIEFMINDKTITIK